jgi:hypothetical protein
MHESLKHEEIRKAEKMNCREDTEGSGALKDIET